MPISFEFKNKTKQKVPHNNRCHLQLCSMDIIEVGKILKQLRASIYGSEKVKVHIVALAGVDQLLEHSPMYQKGAGPIS